MQITCASCKTSYYLTMEQIQGLSYSIMPCKKCSRYIKITACPRCRSYYSITFSSTQQSRYQLNCEKCSAPFIIDFPLIKEPRHINDAIKEKTPRKKISFFKSFVERAEKSAPREETVRSEIHADFQRTPATSAPSAFTLTELFNVCSRAISIPNLFVSSIAIILIILMMLGYNLCMSAILEPGSSALTDYGKSFLNIIPFAIILCIYVLTASFIARNTMNKAASRPGFNFTQAVRFMKSSVMPVFLANAVLFIVMDFIFIVFGRIPVIGPVLFAILFLPIYLMSIVVILFVAIGFWFYPPIIASSGIDPASSFKRLARFIKRHNFSLIYTIPLLSVITTLVFFTIYLVHYGSFSLSLFLSKNILGSDGEKIFSAVPAQLLQISDLALLGSDSGLFRSLVGNVLVAHTVSGFIIGIIFSCISIFLFACFISITATLSTHIYLMMERGADIDDASKIRLLLLVVLILLGLFLVKKIIL